MTTDISKLRRKRTRKRNIVSRTTLIEVDELLKDEQMDMEERVVELSVRLESLVESMAITKKLDDEINI